LFVFLLFFCAWTITNHGWEKEEKYLLQWLCIGVFYVDSTNVKQSNLVLRYEMEKYGLFVVMCEFMCKRKLIIWAFMEKYGLFVVMCEFMCKKKLIIWAFKRQYEFTDQFLLDSYIKKC
jgi:hypothetical protein